MNKAINRTTVQVGTNKFKVYPTEAPIFCKDENGELVDIDLTFKDSVSTIGDISLMEKGIVSVGKRKGNNSYKVVGIRPDNCRDGSKQLEFSLINVELDGVKQEVNVENDLEIKLRPSKVFQFINLKKSFGSCKIEFDIHTKNLELLNEKYKEKEILYDYEFNITNIGSLKGTDAIGMYNSYHKENSDTPSLDCYIGHINDNYITTGEYSIEEEFGDSDLSDYTLERMYPYGGSAYLKDCIIFAAKSNNVENFSEIMINQICDLYDLETIHEDDKNGQYFTKDGKKVASYYSTDNTFLSFFNTVEIPDTVKTLFKRKTFKSTSFLDLTIDKLKSDIEARLNKDLSIEVDTNNYKPIGSAFYIKIKNESLKIGLPLAFDKDYNELKYYTTHTLKDNNDGSFRYTKLLQPIQALLPNKAKYLDVAIAVANGEDVILSKVYQNVNTGTSPPNPKNATNLTAMRNLTTASAAFGGEYSSGLVTFTVDSIWALCGEFFSRQQTGGTQGTAFTVTRAWKQTQLHYIFNTSSITDPVTDASLKFKGCTVDSLSPATGLDVILLKSDYDGTPGNWTGSSAPPAGTYDNFNNFTGHTSGWDSDDVTEYTAEVTLDENVVSSYTGTSDLQDDEISLNSTAKSDIQTGSNFALAMIEHDVYYLDNYNTGITGNFSSPANATYTHQLHGYQVDTTDSANRPYLDVTTGTVSTPTGNAGFFGANF
tara:strand:- start:6051 stop:8186 length:2136 start_codon:yes stop_codon:yes gene_type:complete